MLTLATSASHVTFHQVVTYGWRGFKALPVAVYHLVVHHTASSLLELCYLLGVALFCAVIAALLRFR